MRRSLLPLVMGLACQSTEGHGTGAAAAFEVSADRAQMGFDAPFSIAVHLLDGARDPVDIRWTQVAGPTLRDVAVTEGGLRFSARTPRLSDCREETPPWGVVPFSPRTRGEVVLQAEWRLARSEVSHREQVIVAAAARSRGLPNVPVDERLYLGGTGWRVKEAPPDAGATVQEHDGIATFRPDTRGIWQLIDGEGRALRVQAGRYVETPLDCGRAGCHGEIARASRSSPMTWALTRRLRERARHTAPSAETPSSDLSCAMPCHVTGEPGIHDGGFFDVAADLRVSSSLESVGEMAELPRALRRLGSVGCLACHGPSALPEAEARWSILRSNVCAHCHDAPPRYGHVVAWQTTSMARADHDPQARSDRACTPCHTTWGFLHEIDPHPGQGEIHPRMPPDRVGALGITCPACHAVHDTSGASAERPLLRAPRLPPMFDDVPAQARARSATCLACHGPRDAARLAQASSAALWAGRAGVDPETGAPLTGPSPHLAVEGGCVGCHREGPNGIEHGKNHGFRADRQRCISCHDDATRDLAWAEERAQMEKLARDLWDDLLALRAIARTSPLSATPASDPPHATTAAPGDARSPLARAAFDLSLVLEDRGFLAHNLPYARVLLEKARKPIERASRAVRRRDLEGGR